MALKTNYANYVPSTETKRFNLLKGSDESTIYADVIIDDITTYTVSGDDFGASDINTTNEKVNEIDDIITNAGNIMGFVYGTTAPTGTVVSTPYSKMWLDTSVSPFRMRFWNGVEWEILNSWQ